MSKSIEEKINQAVSSKDIESLKSCGSYLEVKRLIEGRLKNKIYVQGWVSLFDRIHAIKEILSSNREMISDALEECSFNEAKKEVGLILGIKITARSKREFSEKIEIFKSLFFMPTIDPYQRYEETKKRNFKNSSRLEGIELRGIDQHKNLDEIISKYKGGRSG